MANLMEKLQGFILARDAYDEYDEYEEDIYEDEYEEVMESRKEKVDKKFERTDNDKVVKLTSNKKSEVALFEPRKMEEARNIASAIKANKICVISLINTESDEDSQSIADYLTGASFVLNGKITKFSDTMFMASPMNVDVSGAFAQFVKSNKSFFVK